MTQFEINVYLFFIRFCEYCPLSGEATVHVNHNPQSYRSRRHCRHSSQSLKGSLSLSFPNRNGGDALSSDEKNRCRFDKAEVDKRISSNFVSMMRNVERDLSEEQETMRRKIHME